jgi:hypothetical protein
MIEKHYGKYIRGNADEQFQRLLGAKTGTFYRTQQRAAGTEHNEVVEKTWKDIGGPTWIRTRDQPVMSRWL